MQKENTVKQQSINFQELIRSSSTSLSLGIQTEMIQHLTDEFTDEQQKWYIANLYVYMHYHPTEDYPINLENVYKMIGFANKGNAMKAIKSNFVENEDYKILLFHTEKQLHGGHNKEDIMLNIDTFKNLCMITKTEKGKEIRKYYVKLENIYNKIVKNEIEEKQRLIEEQKKLLQEKEKEIEKQNELIKDLENRPETEGFNSRELGELYCIRDNSRPGHIKIGITNDSINRVNQLNVGSSTLTLELYTKFKTFDRTFAERIIHHALHPFKIKKRKEWFYFKDDSELAYAMNTIRRSLEFINQFNIENYNKFKEITNDLDISSELITKNVTRTAIPRSGTFRGVSFDTQKQQWMAQIQHNNKPFFLGYFSDEIDGAKAYNDFALYLNQTENAKFLLNDIPGYKTVPRNIPKLNEEKKIENKSSKFKGVSYDLRRKHWVAGIQFTGKTYNLGNSLDEIECAKLYNQQALYFNNKFKTNYVLNDIPGYITEAKDVYQEIQDNKKKTSRYIGVSLTAAGKWACSYMMNRKKVHIGTFDTELEACREYNKTVTELNKNGCNYKVNKIEEEQN